MTINFIRVLIFSLADLTVYPKATHTLMPFPFSLSLRSVHFAWGLRYSDERYMRFRKRYISVRFKIVFATKCHDYEVGISQYRNCLARVCQYYIVLNAVCLGGGRFSRIHSHFVYWMGHNNNSHWRVCVFLCAYTQKNGMKFLPFLITVGIICTMVLWINSEIFHKNLWKKQKSSTVWGEATTSWYWTVVDRCATYYWTARMYATYHWRASTGAWW